jgi:hypothetical protein
MMNGITMSSFSRPVFFSRISDFRLEKAEVFSGHRESNGATWGSDATNGCCRSDLHGTSGGVRGRHYARPAAVLMFFYTLGTALVGHRYWTMTGTDRVDGMDRALEPLR